ncbi:MAG: rod shape-determining protein MreD [Gammaproteobacteria bacterium]|nr:rod shape-determining protein MreD [Gammaproteobacteria bacterium]
MTLDNKRRLGIAGSFVIAFILASISGPDWLDPLRPDWVALVLIYWCLVLPERIGIGTGWFAGLLLDVVYGSMLGQHALAKTLLAFLVLKLHLRVRIYPPWQQALVVGLLLTINHIIIIWVRTIGGQADAPGKLWFTIIVGAALWPVLSTVLRNLRRRFA